MTQGEDKAWIEWQSKFADEYDNLNYSNLLQSKVMNSSHVFMEKAFGQEEHFDRVLEIGAGTGEHVGFVRHSYDSYLLTDRDPKTLEVAKTKFDQADSDKLRFEVQTGDSLNYPDNSFDRIVAAHVLEHIYQPHLALKEWCRVLKDGGVLSVLIPTDPGIAWRLGRHLGPRSRSIAQGIAYDYVMAREHVNSCNNLIALLRHYFPDAKESWWPLRIPSIDLNLFFVFHAQVNKQAAGL